MNKIILKLFFCFLYITDVNSTNVVNQSNAATQFEINKAALISKLPSLEIFLTQSKLIPLNNKDGSISFRIERFDANSAFALLKIQANDTITKINDHPIKSFNELMSNYNLVLSQLKETSKISNFSLSILRNNNFLLLKYKLLK